MSKRTGVGVALVVVLLSALGVAAAYGQSAPINDNYLSSLIIPQAQTKGFTDLTYTDNEDTTNATTQSDLFNPDKHGDPFGGAGPEPVTCGGATYGKTIWYDLHPQVPIEVELVASGFPTAIAVYQWSPTSSMITRRVSCQLSNGSLNDYAFPFELQAHKLYTVQIGGLQTPTGFASGPLEFTATVFPDHDGDSIVDQLDSCPTLAGIRRFSGCPPRLVPNVSFGWTSSNGSSVRLTAFNVGSLPSGTRVQARCRSCGLNQVLKVGRRAGPVAMSAFVGHDYQAGTKFEIWATKAPSGTGTYRYGAIGAYVSSVVRSGALGGRISRCLMPGSQTPRVTCPPGGPKKP